MKEEKLPFDIQVHYPYEADEFEGGRRRATDLVFESFRNIVISYRAW